MGKLLIACQKFLANVNHSTDPENRYYDIDPQDLHKFIEAVKAAQHSGHAPDRLAAWVAWALWGLVALLSILWLLFGGG